MAPLGPEARGKENGEEVSPSSSDSGSERPSLALPVGFRVEPRPKTVLL